MVSMWCLSCVCFPFRLVIALKPQPHLVSFVTLTLTLALAPRHVSLEVSLCDVNSSLLAAAHAVPLTRVSPPVHAQMQLLAPIPTVQSGTLWASLSAAAAVATGKRPKWAPPCNAREVTYPFPAPASLALFVTPTLTFILILTLL